MAEAPSPASSRGSWKGMQTRFLLAVGSTFLFLELLFLGDISYLYGTEFHQSSRYHNLNLLYVDYDQGVVGQSVSGAYGVLQADSFPTVEKRSIQQYPQPGDVREAVCHGDYWGAIYALPDASKNLAAALDKGDSTPVTLIYVWNEARYPVIARSVLYSNLEILVQTTRSMYYENNAASVFQSANFSNPTTANTFLDPIKAGKINIQPTAQGARTFYNTVSIILSIIMQFFFMMALNGISSHFDVFTKLSFWGNALIRICCSVCYTLVTSLSWSGAMWAFRESWDVNRNQLVLVWMTMWLFMHINFLFFDILTTFIPPAYLPLGVLTWVIINVTSVIAPFDLSPGFYHWGYAVPAHEVFQILTQIWGGGCNNQLYRALPILFMWWVVGILVVTLALRYRLNTALKAQNMMLEDEKKKQAEFFSSEESHRVLHSLPDINVYRPRTTIPAEALRNRRHTMQSIPLRQSAYGPSSPTLWI
ncbi:hypothetical protein N7492_007204 [Penicillium capsulatum]|uniref:DUF3533 domain-containing protein n=1 Tax=Penicillium capsulatum TaxID=69766 RepID=A0A9W9HZD8_9EURO|nr:hypothetical protein N7492_007204 [Penicillium capsulatum]KAJ6117042.1 hypothetical protein N7512_006767 [Penicillium capsulatum]